MKDRISVGKKQYEQKRLILCTLKELYLAFKESNPEVKVGFSKFCTLRPKWCVGAGSSGSHSVCVCTIHQNVILLLHAAQLEEAYKELIGMMVCSEDIRDCMLQKCENCPGDAVVQELLESKFEDRDEIIEIKQWVSVDRTDLVTQSLTVNKYISLLIEQLQDLIPHHFISKAQSKYLRQRKTELDQRTAIILMDFSENYSFHVQDEAQGYHWWLDP